MDVNKLKLNASKTKSMVVRSIRKKLIGNVILKCCDGTMRACGKNEVSWCNYR